MIQAPLLHLEKLIFQAGAPSVPSYGAQCCEHAMAWNNQRDSISTAGITNHSRAFDLEVLGNL